MSEKDQLLSTMERELPKTLNVLKAYPTSKADLRPHELCRTAKDLAWTLVAEGMFADGALAGTIDLTQPTPPAPATMNEVITTYEKKQRALMDRIRKTPDADLNKTMSYQPKPPSRGSADSR